MLIREITVSTYIVPYYSWLTGTFVDLDYDRSSAEIVGRMT